MRLPQTGRARRSAGLGYLTVSFATFLSPPFAAHLYPYVPSLTAFLGEASLMLWLVLKAANVQGWEEQTIAAAGRCDL